MCQRSTLNDSFHCVTAIICLSEGLAVKNRFIHTFYCPHSVTGTGMPTLSLRISLKLRAILKRLSLPSTGHPTLATA